jgi:isoquinoline 1-oxidoreductase beta subunit
MTHQMKKSTPAAAPTRRFILSAASAAGGGLLLGAIMPPSGRRAIAAAGDGASNAVGAWLRIGADETVTILIGAAEMGQGVMTGLPQIVAEELKVNWANVKAEHAPVASVYNNPFFRSQTTGGSTSVRGYFNVLRLAGASAREMLIQAASNALGQPVGNLEVINGAVRVKGTTIGLTYGQLAPAAALLPVPANPPLTPPDAFKLIGTSAPRTDLGGKVDGSAIFGIDVRIPGMVYAAIRHAPKFGATLSGTPAVPSGAIAVVPMGDSVGVVASNTWAAFQAARQLQANWIIPASASQIDSTIISNNAKLAMASTANPGIAEQSGDPTTAFANATRILEWTYDLPFLAHACLEPLNCTASVTPNSCEIWAPTQAITGAASVAASVTGLQPSQIIVHTTFLGGGLGRKGEQDFVRQAVQISKALGRPVKLTWSREEDFTNDFYRPMALSRIRVALGPNGQILGWNNRLVSPSIMISRFPAAVANGVDTQATEGATDLPYLLGARQIEYVQLPTGVPVGFWRSVGHSLNAFTTESAIDELALALGLEPLTFRRQLLGDDSRKLAVLNAAASLAGWDSPPPAGRARGIALHTSFGTIVAQVAEISIDNAAGVKVHRVSCALDCGLAINPDSVEAQIQSAIVHGMASALWGKVGFKAGAADVRNYNAYRMLRLREMPQVSVRIINGGGPLGGMGEPGVPPIAPAIANAYAALTGKRLRSLPLFGTSAGRQGQGGDD